MPSDRHNKNLSNTGADRKLTREEFRKLSWEETWKRAIPIDKDAFFRKHKTRKE